MALERDGPNRVAWSQLAMSPGSNRTRRPTFRKGHSTFGDEAADVPRGDAEVLCELVDCQQSGSVGALGMLGTPGG